MKVLLSLVVLTLASGCAASKNVLEQSHGNRLTVGNVKSSIQKGVTRQSEILSLFGSPNLVTRNQKGDEVWNYSRMSVRGAQSTGGWAFLFAGKSGALSSVASSSFDLIVTFDSQDVVVDYQVISASY